MNFSLWWRWSVGLQIQEPPQLENLLSIQLVWIWEANHMSKSFCHVYVCVHIEDVTRDFYVPDLGLICFKIIKKVIFT